MTAKEYKAICDNQTTAILALKCIKHKDYFESGVVNAIRHWCKESGISEKEILADINRLFKEMEEEE